MFPHTFGLADPLKRAHSHVSAYSCAFYAKTAKNDAHIHTHTHLERVVSIVEVHRDDSSVNRRRVLASRVDTAPDGHRDGRGGEVRQSCQRRLQEQSFGDGKIYFGLVMHAVVVTP